MSAPNNGDMGLYVGGGWVKLIDAGLSLEWRPPGWTDTSTPLHSVIPKYVPTPAAWRWVSEWVDYIPGDPVPDPAAGRRATESAPNLAEDQDDSEDPSWAFEKSFNWQRWLKEYRKIRGSMKPQNPGEIS